MLDYFWWHFNLCWVIWCIESLESLTLYIYIFCIVLCNLTFFCVQLYDIKYSYLLWIVLPWPENLANTYTLMKKFKKENVDLFLFNTNNFQDPLMGPYPKRVNLGRMATRRYSTLFRSPRLELHHQKNLSAIISSPLLEGGVLPYWQGIVSFDF